MAEFSVEYINPFLMAATILSTKGIAMDITPPTLCRGNVYLKQSYSQNICVPLTSDEIHMELDIAINVN